jgi:ribosomal protein S18 acetylase RimI-like enzyme
MNQLPEIPGYTWRPLAEQDEEALLAFEAACAEVDGATKLRTLSEWQEVVQAGEIAAQSRIAVNEAGEVVAVGWFEVDDRVDAIHAFLEARVHPYFRLKGIGVSLLLWLEERAIEAMAKIANEDFGRLNTSRSQLLRLIFYDRAPDAIALFEKQGYERQYAEDEYLFDLKRSLPLMESSPDLVWECWTAENSDDFYTAYRESFATRTDNLMTAAAWAHHFAKPGDDEFQPELSVLLRRGDDLLGFAVVHIKNPQEGWITQVGVSAKQRRQGRGAAIMVRVLNNMAEAGFERALLQVNQDNPQARALYEALGFAKTKTLYAYTKSLSD